MLKQTTSLNIHIHILYRIVEVLHQKRCKNIRLEIKKISFVLLFREVEMFLNNLHIHSYCDNRYYYERIEKDAVKRESSIKEAKNKKLCNKIVRL